MKLSVVVVVHDMAREAPRTLRSLAVPYQQGVVPEDYEVIVVDNGSPVPLGEEVVASFGPNFRYYYLEDAPPSPVAAVNFGVARGQGDVVGVCIDGARIVTPGLLRHALAAFRAWPSPTVAALGWHLGPGPQQRTTSQGYGPLAEDRLLDAIGWPEDGYRLFEIAVLTSSSAHGCFAPIAESNTLFLTRKAWDEIGGMDPAFDAPGGGLANLDLFKRACERPDAQVVILLGEGSFHQVHRGVSTNVAAEESDRRFAAWAAQYREIRGEEWRMPEYTPVYLGCVPDQALEYVAWSALHRLGREVGQAGEAAGRGGGGRRRTSTGWWQRFAALLGGKWR